MNTVSLHNIGIQHVEPFARIDEATTYLQGCDLFEGHSYYTTRKLIGVDGPDVVSFNPADVIRAPGLLAFTLTHLDLAAEYLGCESTIYAIGAMATRPGKEPPLSGVQQWHRDYDDQKFVALFIYGTAVIDQDDGAHLFIPCTQDGTGNVGMPVIPVLGEAGYAWLEDSHGFHMSTKPLVGTRLLIQARFGSSRRPRAHTEFFGSPPPLITEKEIHESGLAWIGDRERAALDLLVQP